MTVIDRKINFAVVGLGHIGKRHARMVRRHPECALVGLADPNGAGEVPEDIGTVPFFPGIVEALIGLPLLDVVIIATPNGLHAEHALSALDAGKHVIIEKPMTLRRQDAEAVIHKALNVQRQVLVVMQNRYSPVSVWAKSLVTGGRSAKSLW